MDGLNLYGEIDALLLSSHFGEGIERKDVVLKKMLPPNAVPISKLSKQENIPRATLYCWRKEAQLSGRLVASGVKSKADDWSSGDKFSAVLETASKNQAELSLWCREYGVYPGQIEEWRIACEQANDGFAVKQKQLEKQQKTDKSKIGSLERELRHKEKALGLSAIN